MNTIAAPSSNPTFGFTLQEYQALLIETLIKYRCVGFEVLDEPDMLRDNFCILRHDIDMSPACALDLAKLESALGIRTTYTVLLTGEFYNPFEVSTCKTIQAISALGHDIGLHFDATWHGINSEADLEDAITWEANMLNRLLGPVGGGVRMFSFHNTTPFSMSCKQTHYAGLRNAYAGVLQEQVSYTSDSNGYWIHRSWVNVLNERPARIQVLTHPEWWTEKKGEPAEKVCQHLDSRSRIVWTGYCDSLASTGRNNKTGVVDAFAILPALVPEDGADLLYTWLCGNCEEAFIDLYCRVERKSRRLCRKYFRTALRASSNQVNAVLSDCTLRLDPIAVLACIANENIETLLGCSLVRYQSLKKLRHGLVHGSASAPKATLQTHFNLLALLMQNLVNWASTHTLDATGAVKLTTRNMPKTLKATGDALPNWLKKHMKELDVSDGTLRKFLARYPNAFAANGKSSTL